MPRKRPLLSCAIAAPCLIVLLAAAIPARAGTIPAYFFSEWTVASNCTEANAGPAARVAKGLKFSISQDSAAQNGTYALVTRNVAPEQWSASWNGLRLQYRPGTPMTNLPADFECIAGQEATSSFLTMSNYAVAAEPYYQQEHWYALAKISGQLEHILIFPRNALSGVKAVVVMLSVNSPGAVQLDDNGVIHME